MSASAGASQRRLSVCCVLLVLLACSAGELRAQWVEFQDETATRLSSLDPGLGVSDPEEKDYAWGDLDRDGDIDLVVVRKQPFTSPGKKVAVLFMNENGVLVDRTTQYATDADVPGDLGFNTPTNNRDVILVDVNADNWLDIVTAVTISDGDPKHIGHPRVYRNKGNDGGGAWLGFRFENFRIQQMISTSGQTGFNPRFCSVAAGDLTGDGKPDLWFGDYDSSGDGGSSEPAGADFDDRLLINQGAGSFKDLTTQSFAGMISIPGSAPAPFPVSAFGAAEVIDDMNGDGLNDIIKQTSLNDPLYVGIAYNRPSPNQGSFNTYEVVTQQSPYFVSAGDLNNDNKKDLVITDDGADRYMLNQGNGTDGLANFISTNFSYDAASDDGFGSDSVIADLNNDGWNDVLIADVDVDISGCSRRMHIYRNLGGTPGGNVVLQEQTTGTGCATSQGNPASCRVASIPSNMLEGVHDVAVFDINGDGWKDLVVGRCTGTEVYINQPPIGLAFSYPQGLPLFVPPGEPFDFQVQVTGFGGAVHQPGSGRMFVSLSGGPFNETVLNHLGGGLYEATLQAPPACAETMRFYFSAQTTGASTFKDPALAPADTYRAVSALGIETTLEDGFEGDISGWTVANHASLTSGAWQRAVPNGTITGTGQQAAPSEDAEAPTSATQAFVTQNGPPGGSASANDVDFGPTDLISPAIDLADTDASISVSRWFFSTGNDTMTIWVSNNGTDWVQVETIGAANNSWQVSSFKVSDYVAPNSTVQVRFRTSDNPNNSTTEAAVDAFRVEEYICGSCLGPQDCDDGVFCNGAEDCLSGSCVPGSYPCGSQQCDEANDTCVQCLSNAHCDDGNFCNGAETCSANSCVPGTDPCPGQMCNEGSDLCVDCLVDADCDDGLFCNGGETCNSGVCFSPAEACPGQLCDEADDACIGAVQLQPRMGQPLLGLDGPQRGRFQAGRDAFDLTFTSPTGLGPIFNQDSCGSCHNTPLGGSGSIMVTRFGFNDDKGVGFDPLASLGGSLLQAEALSEACREQVPTQANVTANRLTNSTLGFGLVEAIPDSSIEANATTPPPLVSGRVHTVPTFENPGPLRAGRFGWKAQVATVLTFSADAALNEMGITNRFVTTENDPNGVDPPSLGSPDNCDTIPDPEDGPDQEGLHFIDRVTDFQRFLAQPPQTPRSGMSGETLFNSIGCASCHVRNFTTSNDLQFEPFLRNKVVKPYSDFLLHDMGQAADFIQQGNTCPGPNDPPLPTCAEQEELRTPPLWGLRVRDPMWHDGRVAGGTFADRISGVITQHNALNSEAQAAAGAYGFLTTLEKAAVVAFLDSLGRAEFDQDGDSDVDSADHQAFQSCFTGPGVFYTPDSPCSISDVDQDGDVDDDDFDLFVAAAQGVAGRVPDGASAPGTPLLLERATKGQITLSWGDSCLSADTDFEVYEGTLGNFVSHAPRLCATGAMNATIAPAAGDAYYLIVPTNGFREGSYGSDSAGAQRSQGASACLPQSVGACK